MRDDEVLAAGLADDARVVPIVRDVRADRLPHSLEDRGGAGEVHASEVRACQRGIPDLRARPVDEVDDAGREPGGLVQFHQVVRGVRRGRRRLPEDRVPHQRGAAREVAADRREVEGRHREDKTFERPVLHPVPRSGRRQRLLLVDAEHELHVEAEEVRQLTRRVDLGLVDGLGLSQHGGGVERRAPGAGQELGGAEEDGRAVLPRRPVPLLPRVGGRLDRLLDVRGAAFVHGRQHVALVVWHHRFERVARAHLLAADHERQLELLRLHLVQPALQLLALGRSRRVVLHRFVLRRRGTEEAGSCGHQGRL